MAVNVKCREKFLRQMIVSGFCSKIMLWVMKPRKHFQVVGVKNIFIFHDELTFKAKDGQSL